MYITIEEMRDIFENDRVEEFEKVFKRFGEEDKRELENPFTCDAVNCGAVKIFEFLSVYKKPGIDLDAVSENHRNREFFFLSAKNGSLTFLNYFLEKNIDINVQDEKGLTALAVAMQGGQSRAVNLLLERGADVNVLLGQGQSGKDETILHYIDGIISFFNLPILEKIIAKFALWEKVQSDDIFPLFSVLSDIHATFLKFFNLIPLDHQKNILLKLINSDADKKIENNFQKYLPYFFVNLINQPERLLELFKVLPTEVQEKTLESFVIVDQKKITLGKLFERKNFSEINLLSKIGLYQNWKGSAVKKIPSSFLTYNNLSVLKDLQGHISSKYSKNTFQKTFYKLDAIRDLHESNFNNIKSPIIQHVSSSFIDTIKNLEFFGNHGIISDEKSLFDKILKKDQELLSQEHIVSRGEEESKGISDDYDEKYLSRIFVHVGVGPVPESIYKPDLIKFKKDCGYFLFSVDSLLKTQTERMKHLILKGCDWGNQESSFVHLPFGMVWKIDYKAINNGIYVVYSLYDDSNALVKEFSVEIEKLTYSGKDYKLQLAQYMLWCIDQLPLNIQQELLKPFTNGEGPQQKFDVLSKLLIEMFKNLELSIGGSLSLDKSLIEFGYPGEPKGINLKELWEKIVSGDYDYVTRFFESDLRMKEIPFIVNEAIKLAAKHKPNNDKKYLIFAYLNNIYEYFIQPNLPENDCVLISDDVINIQRLMRLQLNSEKNWINIDFNKKMLVLKFGVNNRANYLQDFLKTLGNDFYSQSKKLPTEFIIHLDNIQRDSLSPEGHQEFSNERDILILLLKQEFVTLLKCVAKQSKWGDFQYQASDLSIKQTHSISSKAFPVKSIKSDSLKEYLSKLSIKTLHKSLIIESLIDPSKLKAILIDTLFLPEERFGVIKNNCLQINLTLTELIQAFSRGRLNYKLSSDSYFENMAYTLFDRKICGSYAWLIPHLEYVKRLLSKPYKGIVESECYDDINLKLRGIEIERPNHNIVHVIRTLLFLILLTPHLAKFARDERMRNFYASLTPEDIRDIQLALAFYVTGRESEVTFTKKPHLVKKYKIKSAENYASYARKIGVKEETINMYAPMLEYVEFIYDPQCSEQDLKKHCLSQLIYLAHIKDLGRCLDEEKYASVKPIYYVLGSPSNNEKIAFNLLDLENGEQQKEFALLDHIFTQCIINTGDRVMRDGKEKDYDDRFLFYSNNIPECFKILQETINQYTVIQGYTLNYK